jgi:hypothetical protein
VDLRQRAHEVLAFGLGEVGGDLLLQEPPFRLDRLLATVAEAVRSRFPNGAPPALAEAAAETLTLMRADTVGFRTDTVERLLGRPPRTFVDWCTRNADAFRRPADA